MSVQVSAPTKPQDVIVRRSAQYSPSIWGDHFLPFATVYVETDDKTHGVLKEQVRVMLVNARNTPSQKLNLIDAVQRLGVSYHFETEIEEALQHIHNNNNHDSYSSCDLYNVSLQFRLLRQHGYHVQCDVFNEFKDSTGEFMKSLASDVRGMLGLYEATHMRVHGEDVLEEALSFTTTHLKVSLESPLSPSLAAQVSYAMKQPLHKSVQRIEQRSFISEYETDPSHNELLLTFAKLDFNILQKIHQKELGQLTRWWKDLDIKTKLPYARDRLVECYLWSVFVFYEPNYALGRRLLTKMLKIISIVDDTYDNYGTLEELELLTEAIQRWDIASLNQLQEYMQVCYVALLGFYSEMEEEMACEGKSYAVSYAKEAMKALVRAYLQEAKWFNEQYTPTMEEYMSVGLVTSTLLVLTTTIFIGMQDNATKDAFDRLHKYPKILMGAATIGRLMDDIVFLSAPL